MRMSYSNIGNLSWNGRAPPKTEYPVAKTCPHPSLKLEQSASYLEHRASYLEHSASSLEHRAS